MYIKIGEVARQCGVTTQAVRKWEQSGLLIPAKVLQTGTRYYTQEQVDEFLGNRTKKESDTRITIGYCRVSSHSQKDDLERQIDLVDTYIRYRWDNYEIIQDIGSGINYEKKGLKQLIYKMCCGEVSRIVILHKDRLLRFGYELIEYLAELYEVELLVIEQDEDKSDSEELAEDIVNIITVYSARLNGKRAWENRKRREMEGL